ncbi:MAG: NADH-quinone oxidoreductase subunit M [Rickettsia sp.]|nr:NADH-quinone oxidoreductase subunit M [Rickettsia sp.]
MKYFLSVSFAVYLPIISGLIALLISTFRTSWKLYLVKFISIFTSIILIIWSLLLLSYFDRTTQELQFVEKYLSIPKIGFEIFWGIDGLSIYFIILTVIISCIAKIYSIFVIKKDLVKFLLCFLLLESFCIGAFSTLNLLVFYCFFELVLLPMYLIIGIWGGKNKIYASIKFFLYTFLGSLLFLISLIFIYVHLETLNIIELYSASDNFSLPIQKILWFFIFISFAIKLPLVPFHTWLADAHVQAPTSGSIMLAGVLLKIGGYALIRILFPMFPEINCLYSKYITYLSSFAVIYGALVAFNNKDIKKIIAYSSVSHMGYVSGGIFSITINGVKGAIFQMISHGLVSSALFLIIGILYERNKDRDINNFGGFTTTMPNLSFYFTLVLFASVALPGSSGFVGEFLSILGIYQENIFAGILAGSGIILGPIYMLNLYRHVMLGPFKKNFHIPDLFKYEKFLLMSLVLIIYILGIVPNIIFNVITCYVNNLMSFFEVL